MSHMPPPPPPDAPAPQPAAPVQIVQPPAAKPSGLRRVAQYLGTVVIVLSLVANLYMAMLIGAMADTTFDTTVLRKGDEQNVIAVYSVAGVIANDAAREFGTFVRKISDDDTIKAVVLRVDSPGGTVAASEQIHHMVTQLKETGRPIVISMGSVAASGGYLISVAAEDIVAEPSTITGSIGVIAQLPNLEGTMDKLGVKVYTYKSTDARAWKDALNQFRPPRKHEVAQLMDMLNAMQERFEQHVRTGRGDRLKTRDEEVTITVGEDDKAQEKTITVEAPLNGKVYLAEEALELGLIDKIGYIDSAMDLAAKRAGLSNPRVVAYDTSPGLLEKMLFGAHSAPTLPSVNLDAMGTPKLMMIWKMD